MYLHVPVIVLAGVQYVLGNEVGNESHVVTRMYNHHSLSLVPTYVGEGDTVELCSQEERQCPE